MENKESQPKPEHLKISWNISTIHKPLLYSSNRKKGKFVKTLKFYRVYNLIIQDGEN